MSGQADSQFAAYRALKICVGGPSAGPGPTPPKPPGPSSNVSEEVLVYLKRRDDFCRSVTERDQTQRMSWLKHAAEGNSIDALLELAHQSKETSESHRLLNSAWNLGSLRALWELSQMYGIGAIGKDSAGRPDTSRALGYAWLYWRLNEQAFRKHGTQSDFVGALGKVVERRLSVATESERAAALQMARQTLASNSACCVVP